MDYLFKIKNEKNTTMIFTSHNLLELEKLCDRIILIDSGKIIFDGSVKRLIKFFSPLYRLEVKLLDKYPDLEDIPVEKISLKNDILTITYDKQKIETAQIIKFIMKKVSIGDVKIYEPDLEETIKKIYEVE